MQFVVVYFTIVYYNQKSKAKGINFDLIYSSVGEDSNINYSQIKFEPSNGDTTYLNQNKARQVQCSATSVNMQIVNVQITLLANKKIRHFRLINLSIKYSSYSLIIQINSSYCLTLNTHIKNMQLLWLSNSSMIA